MFSKYEEISKLIRTYIEESLIKPMAGANVLNDKINQTYGVSLSEADLVNLQNSISVAKKTRNDYEIGVQNSFKATTDWSNALDKAKDLVAKREGEARNYATVLSNKLCIMLYKGPLTLDTMKELKEHGYDGTYGSTTMMQFYSLYNEKQKLEEKNNEQKAVILQNEVQIDSFRQQYTVQYQAFQQVQVENNTLKSENENLRTYQSTLTKKISEQNTVIQSLVEKVESLSKKLPVQILESIKGFFKTGKEQNLNQVSQQVITEEAKTMR